MGSQSQHENRDTSMGGALPPSYHRVCVCVSLGFHTDVHQSDMITEKTLPEFNWNLIIIFQRSEKPSLQLFDLD